MITSRPALLQKLRTVAPALAGNDIVPGLTHFSFDGARIVACNEQIALSVPQYGDYQGLLPPLLLEVLAGSSAPAVRIEGDGEGVAQVALGASVTTLPSCPIEQYPFEMPTGMPQHRVPAAFLHGIKHCMPSISAYATVPDQLGVTLITDGQDDLRLFATNRSTISDARVRWAELKLQKRVILSTAFCEQMLKLAKTAKTLRLDTCDGGEETCPACSGARRGSDGKRCKKCGGRGKLRFDAVLFSADDITLYGRLITLSFTPLNFVYVVEQHVPQDFATKSIPIYKELRGALKRAAHLTSVVGRESLTKIIVKDGMATVEAVSERGQLRERLALPNHPDVEINVNARLLVEGLRSGLDRVLFDENCAILAARGAHYVLIAAFDD